MAAIALAGTGVAAPAEPITLKEHTGWVGGVAFSPDGNSLATASADNTVKLWDTTTWKNTATLKGHTDYVVTVAFASDKKTLVSGSFDHTAIVWDLETGKPRHTIKKHSGAVLAVAVHPDGKHFSTGSIDGTVRLWKLDTAREWWGANEHQSWVNALAYSPNGKHLASVSSDTEVWLRDNDGAERIILRPKVAEVRSVAFSPDSKLFAAGTRYGLTKVWDTAKGDEVVSLKGKGGDVWGVAFSHDGKLLATADGDWNKPSDIVLWDTTTWKERGRLRHTNEVLCIAFHPKKPVLAAGALDRTVKVWDLTELLKDKR